MNELIRLQKYLAQAGIASRREAEKIIAAGDVKVNGEVVRTQGIKIDPQKDQIEVYGKVLVPQEKRYYLLNKPKGYVCSKSDRHAEKTIFELMPKDVSLHNVGRLDKDTEGLILLTNDGALTQKLTHPSYEVDKTYQALVRGKITDEALEKLRRGVEIPVDEKMVKTLPAQVRCLNRGARTSTVELTIREGRKRQVRLMLQAVGFPVIELKRTREDFLNLSGLKTGEYRQLTTEEVKRLKND